MKNKNLKSIAAILVFSINCNSQTFLWANTIGGPSADNANCVTMDPSGNEISVGFFNNSADFDPGPAVFTVFSNGTDDAFIQKLDPSGNFIWAKQIGGISNDFANGVATDASGNVYITGSYVGTVDFDPGIGVYNLSSVGAGTDIFILKLDAFGNFVWAYSYGTSTNTETGKSIKLDAIGNVYICGLYNNFPFVQKRTPVGNLIWHKQMNGANNANSIAVDGSGAVVTIGSYNNTVDFDPNAGVFNLTSNGFGDVYIQKLDSSGNFLWAKGFGCAPSNDDGNSIAIDGANNIYATGAFANVTNFGVATLTSYGSNDIFIIKYDPSGTAQWVKQIGGFNAEFGFSIAVDAASNVYTTGKFLTTAVDFDPGAGVSTVFTNGMDDAFVSKLDGAGNFIWAFNIGGTLNDYGNAIAANTSIVYIAGYFNGTADFNGGTPVYNLSSTGNSDGFITKYANCTLAPSQPGNVIGSDTICQGPVTQTYSIANVSDATFYTWILPGGWSGSSTTNTISAIPGTTGIFTVVASNACGASPQQTLNVIVNPLPSITVNSGAICSGQSFTIVPSGANTYTIQGGNAVVSPTTTSSYTVSGTSTAGCVSASSATSNVIANPLPTVTASTSNSIICGPPFQGTATLTASGASTYTWNTTATTTAIAVSPSVTIIYTVTGTDANGCINTTSFTQSVSTCTSLSELQTTNSELNIYPNPGSGIIHVSGAEKGVLIFVYNSLGELILSVESQSETVDIDLKEKTNGIYFIKIDNATHKIIKQ